MDDIRHALTAEERAARFQMALEAIVSSQLSTSPMVLAQIAKTALNVPMIVTPAARDHRRGI